MQFLAIFTLYGALLATLAYITCRWLPHWIGPPRRDRVLTAEGGTPSSDTQSLIEWREWVRSFVFATIGGAGGFGFWLVLRHASALHFESIARGALILHPQWWEWIPAAAVVGLLIGGLADARVLRDIETVTFGTENRPPRPDEEASGIVSTLALLFMVGLPAFGYTLAQLGHYYVFEEDEMIDNSLDRTVIRRRPLEDVVAICTSDRVEVRTRGKPATVRRRSVALVFRDGTYWSAHDALSTTSFDDIAIEQIVKHVSRRTGIAPQVRPILSTCISKHCLARRECMNATMGYPMGTQP